MLGMVVEKWKEVKCPSVDGWVKKKQSNNTMEHRSVIKRNGVLTHAFPLMDHKALSYGKKPDRKDKSCVSPYL